MQLASMEGQGVSRGWEGVGLGHLHHGGVAAVLGSKGGEEGEVGRVVVGLVLTRWILLVG